MKEIVNNQEIIQLNGEYKYKILKEEQDNQEIIVINKIEE